MNIKEIYTDDYIEDLFSDTTDDELFAEMKLVASEIEDDSHFVDCVSSYFNLLTVPSEYSIGTKKVSSTFFEVTASFFSDEDKNEEYKKAA